MLAVAIAVKLDGGPVLFRQSRVGKHGTDFGMLKFRSMVVDAEARLTPLAARDEGAGPLFTVCADPRVTRVGCVLRRYSLDELPQLFNVVTGAMHLVGPRPALRREVAAYCPLAARRLAVEPGLTGLWQISGRSDLTWDESIHLDAEYVERWSRCSTCPSWPAPPVRSPAPGRLLTPFPHLLRDGGDHEVHDRGRVHRGRPSTDLRRPDMFPNRKHRAEAASLRRPRSQQRTIALRHHRVTKRVRSRTV
ncbi:sugar transferase [Pseudonocardia sp. HH130629-09]|uniref:sugar transferase n=1 Tax=Pseudonocardia sp. HH130629-09 TaxID=1641402 RepID=UPI000760E100